MPMPHAARCTLPWLLLAAMLSPGPAAACGLSPSFAVIHSALPNPLPAGAFIADVEIEPGDTERIYTTGLRATVRRPIAGAQAGEQVIIRLPETVSCDAPFLNGRAGLVVGLPRNRESGLLVVWPWTVSSYDDFRLPDGFQFEASPANQTQRIGQLGSRRKSR